MNKKFIACLVIISLLSINTLTPAQAFWPFSNSEPGNKDLSFATVYPVHFWKTTIGKILIATSVAAIFASVTYFTAGTGGKAINAGLALLGGGAVLAGGFGILGGISVINAVGSLALSAAIDIALSQVPCR